MRSSRIAALAAVAFASILVAAPSAHAVRLAPVGVFASPTYVTAPPGDQHRLFVTERAGTIRVVRDGIPLPIAFLEMGPVSLAGEGGLLSMAFAPDYASSGRFYTYSTPTAAAIQIDEWRRSADSADRADPASRRTIIVIPHAQFTNHYGGQLQFGPDGHLYLAPGDGGGAGDPNNNGQNVEVLLAKMLRIDPDTPSGSLPYTIPPDNPFVGTAGLDEIWAYGLRNPFRFSFDRATGDLTIGDVGQNTREEVDFTPAPGGGRGANFGWSIFEGTLQFKPGTAPGHVPPVLERPRNSTGCTSITGGYVVRDPSLAELQGRYVYGDFCSGDLRSAVLQVPQAQDDRPLGLNVPALASFGEDALGCVYAVSLGGPVFRLAPDLGVPAGPCGLL